MTNEKQKSEQLLQLNRHLKEWNDNVALEIKARYTLSGKHKFETNRLALKEIDPVERTQLVALHLRESDQLKQHNIEARVAIEERHVQETERLKSRFMEKVTVWPGIIS